MNGGWANWGQSVVNVPFQFFFCIIINGLWNFDLQTLTKSFAIFVHSKHASSTGYVCIANESEFSDNEDSCTG